MEENLDPLIAHLDMDEPFDEQVSLKTLIGNTNSRAILYAYIRQFYNDKIAGRNPQLSPILLVGGKGTGVHAVARSISNSFGNLVCHIITGDWISEGVINLNQFFGEGNEHSSYYICYADKLNSICQVQLWKILTDKQISYYNYELKCWAKKEFENRLIILSVENKDILSYLLLRQFKIQVNLTKLTTKEIELALNQRVRLLNWKISSDDLLTKITQSCPEIGLAMEVLSMAHLVMRAGNEDILNEKYVNTALHLMDNNIKAASQNWG